jgi:hypothetical protein
MKESFWRWTISLVIWRPSLSFVRFFISSEFKDAIWEVHQSLAEFFNDGCLIYAAALQASSLGDHRKTATATHSVNVDRVWSDNCNRPHVGISTPPNKKIRYFLVLFSSKPVESGLHLSGTWRPRLRLAMNKTQKPTNSGRAQLAGHRYTCSAQARYYDYQYANDVWCCKMQKNLAAEQNVCTGEPWNWFSKAVSEPFPLSSSGPSSNLPLERTSGSLTQATSAFLISRRKFGWSGRNSRCSERCPLDVGQPSQARFATMQRLRRRLCRGTDTYKRMQGARRDIW